RKAQVKPGPLGEGTRVEVRDLFYATPARLKCLKRDRSEGEAIREVVRRLAMSRPDVAFTLAGEERAPVTWAAALPGASGRLARLADILGGEFRANAVEVRGGDARLAVEGFAALPTLTRANSLGQYLFVNGRPVRDKLLIGVVRAAYADYLPRDRHPIVALFVALDPREVDVNVHPAKAEVRFRDGGLVRGVLIRALQEALAREGQRAATTGGSATVAAFRPAALPRRGTWDWRQSPSRPIDARGMPLAARGHGAGGLAEAAQAAFDVGGPAADARMHAPPSFSATGSPSSRSGRARSRCARLLRCSVRSTHRRSCAISPSTWRNGTRRCRSSAASCTSPPPWPATARCARAAVSRARR